MERKDRRSRLAQVLLLWAGLLAAGIGLLWLSPPCLIYQVTGLQCTGCGTQRMLLALLEGNLPQAFGYNPFFFVVLPLATLFLLWESLRYCKGKRLLLRGKRFGWVIWGIVGLGLIFMVIRNL